jgi:hypothetical protein
MGLRTWWAQRQQRKARRYLVQHQGLALDVLRKDPDLATQAAVAAMGIEAANSPDRKTIEWPILSQFGGGRNALGTTLPKASPSNLRRFSEMPPARRAINALSDPVIEMPWSIEVIPPVDHDKAYEDKPPTPEQHANILACARMFEEPSNDIGWREFLEIALEDLLVYGAASIEIAPTRQKDRPLFLWNVDTQSIRINAHWDGSPESMRYSQALGFTGIGVAAHDAVSLRDKDLLYCKLNPRSYTPFGLGYLEVAFQAVNAFAGAFDFAERRASNATPNYIIFLGENVTMDMSRRWVQWWENEIEGRGKIPIMGGGHAPTVQPLSSPGQDPLFLAWQEWLVRIIAMAFGLSPMKLNLERDTNRNTADTQATNDWATVAPVANALGDAFTRKLLWGVLGYRDLRFAWKVKNSDELLQAQVLAEEYTMNAITVDELRAFYERPPLPDGLGDMTKSAYENMTKAAAMQGTLPGQASPDGMPGGDSQSGQSAPMIRSTMPLGDDEAILSPKDRALHRALLSIAHSQKGA